MLERSLSVDPTEAAVAAVAGAVAAAGALVVVGLTRAGSGGGWLRCSFCSVFFPLFSSLLSFRQVRLHLLFHFDVISF